MTIYDFSVWNKLSRPQQAHYFRMVRKSKKLTQKSLGQDIALYGYTGGTATVKSWEQNRSRIPPLIYELIKEDFTCREKDEVLRKVSNLINRAEIRIGEGNEVEILKELVAKTAGMMDGTFL